MGKGTRGKAQSKKKCKRSESRICKRERQAILRKLRKITMSHGNSNGDASYARACSFPERDARGETAAIAFIRDDDGRDEDTARNDNCYRCRHFSRIPRNLSRPSCERTSGPTARRATELSFVQALVWLKSATACVSRISVEQLRRIFRGQWRADETGDTPGDVARRAERSESLADRDPSTYDYEDYVTRSTIEISSVSPSTSYVTRVIIPESFDGSSTRERRGDRTAARDKRARVFPTRSPAAPRTSPRHLPSYPSPETFGMSPDMFASSTEYGNARLESAEAERRSIRPASKSHAERTNGEMTINAIVARDRSARSRFDRNASVAAERRVALRNEQRRANDDVSPTIAQFTESNLRSLLNSNLDDECFTPIASQSKRRRDDEPTSDCSLVVTQADIYSQGSGVAATWTRQDDSNSYDRASARTPSDNESQFDVRFADDFDTRINTVAVRSPRYDSAYSTSNIDIRNYDVETRAKGAAREADRRVSDDNAKRHYELRSYKKRTITGETKTANSPSILRKTGNVREKRPVAEESESARHRSGGKEETISAAWLSFTLESLNVDRALLESSKIILSTLRDKSIAEEYAKRRYWRDTLEEEALNAVLNVSDIFRIERKPNILRREIVTTIIKTLNESAKCVQLNQTSVWTYRIEIILELCNSLSICVDVIDHLIAKLKFFPSMLTDTVNIRRNTHNQLRLILYALNITLQKYRTVMPYDRKSRSAEAAIPHVADLWSARYIDEELDNASLNLDAAEKRWAEALEDFAIISTRHYVQFADKSSSLLRVLISQYHEYNVRP